MGRAAALPVVLGLRQVPGEDGGDVLGAHAGQVQVDLWRPFDRGPWPWERLSGPRHSVERVQGSAERGPGAGRVLCVQRQRHMSRPTRTNGTGARG